jgi:hypothetical protein
MLYFELLAARQRHEEMVREAALNRLAQQLAGETPVESLIRRMAKLLSTAWLPARTQQPDAKVTHPRPA